MVRHWRKLLPALAIGVSGSFAVVALLVFSGPDHNNQPTISQPNSPLAGGGGGPDFISPSRITQGDWEPPGFSNIPTEDKPLVAQHVGETINGIRIIDFGEIVTGSCPGQQKPSGLPFPFEASYLPPNTFEIMKPDVLVCPNGQMESAHRSFQIGGEGALALFGIAYADAEPVAYGWGDVQAMTINGWPSVALAPAKNNGVEVGGGAVVMVTPNGVLEVSGSGMPLDELVKIAQGLKCEKC